MERGPELPENMSGGNSLRVVDKLELTESMSGVEFTKNC